MTSTRARDQVIGEPLSKLADETGSQHYENPLENVKPVDRRTSASVLAGRLYPKMVFHTCLSERKPGLTDRVSTHDFWLSEAEGARAPAYRLRGTRAIVATSSTVPGLVLSDGCSDLDYRILAAVRVGLVAVVPPVVLELAAVDEVAKAVGTALLKIDGDREIAVRSTLHRRGVRGPPGNLDSPR